MNTKRFLFIIGFVLLAPATSAWAGNAVPELLPFQGRATDMSGVPVSYSATFNFRVYPPTGACYIYEDTQVVVPNNYGFFTTILGGLGNRTGPANSFGAAFSNATVADSCGGTYTAAAGDWRRIEIVIDGVPMPTMQTIASTPFSINSEMLNGLTSDQFIQVQGTTTQANINALVGGGDASSLHNHDSVYAKLSGSNTFAGNTTTTGSIYAVGVASQIGIGTNAPTADFEIDRASPSILLRANAGGGGTPTITFDSGTTARASIQASESSNDLRFFTGQNEVMHLDASQNVTFDGGVNVTKTLQLGAYTSATEPALLTTLTLAGAAAKGTTWMNTSSNQFKFWDGAQVVSLGANQYVTQVTAGTGLMNSGTGTAPILNVAYGSAPGTAIQGNATFSGDVYGNYTNLSVVGLQGRWVSSTAPTAGQILKFNGLTNAWEPAADNNSGGTITSLTGGTGLLGGTVTLAGTLSVDVGTAPGQIAQLNSDAQLALSAGSATSPTYSFANSSNSGLFAPAPGQLALATNGTGSIYIDSLGRVGIGSSAPTATLDVNGSFNATTFSGNGDGLKFSGAAGSYLFRNAGGNLVAGSLTDNTQRLMFAPSGSSTQLMLANTVSGALAGSDGLEMTLVNNDAAIVNHEAGALSLATNNVGRVVIDQNGLVGIGTASPSTILDINGLGANSAVLLPRDTTANRPTTAINGMLRYNSSTNQLESFINGTWQMLAAGPAVGSVQNVTGGVGLLGGTITTSGTLNVNVGSGANQIVGENSAAQIVQTPGSPAAPSFAFDGSPNTGFYAPSPGSLAMVTSGTTAVTLGANGYLGVGTTAPNYAVDINAGAGGLQVKTSGGQTMRVDAQGLSVNSNAVIGANTWGGVAQVETYGTTPANVGYLFRGAASQSADAFRYVDSGGNTLAAINAAGGANFLGLVGIGTNAPQAGLDINTTGANSAVLLPRDSTTNRPGAPVNGMIRYNTSLNAFEGFAGGIWQAIASGTAVGSVQSVVSGSGLVGGTITANGTINVDLGTAAFKVVQENASAQIAQGNGQAGAPAFSFGQDPTTGLYSPGVGVAALATAGTARLTIDASGRIGVGTTAPAFALDVAGVINATLGLNVSSGQNVQWGSNALAISGSSATNSLQFTTNSLERMRIDANGNVGIGTASPQAGLDINTTGANSALILPRDTTPNRPTAAVNGMIRYNVSNNTIESFVAGQWQVVAVGSGVGTVQTVVAGTGLSGGTITANGTLNVNVGYDAGLIPQENSRAQLAQNSGNAGFPAYSFNGDNTTGLFSPAAGSIGVSTAGTARLTISNAGNVGIGTTAATAALELLGAPSTGGNTSYLRVGSSDLGDGFAVGNLSGNSGQMAPALVGQSNQSQATGLQLIGKGADNATSNVPMIQFTAGQTNGDLMTGAPAGIAYRPLFDFTNASTSVMRITSAGFVGIGTTSPAAGFDIATSGTAGSALIVPRDTTANRPSAAVNGMIRYNSTANVFEAYANGIWQTLAAGTAVGTVQNITGGSGLLGGTITANGTLSVDFGTAALKVVQENPNAQITQGNGNAALPAYSFANDPDTGLFDLGNGTAALATNGTARFVIDGAGNIGVGTTAPSATLDLQAPAGQIALRSTTTTSPTYAKFMNFASALFGLEGTTAGTSMTDSLGGAAIVNNVGSAAVQLGTNNAARLTITPTGAVGIGTNAPAAGLDLALTGNVNSAVILPRDSTANRPIAPVNGMIRYNTVSNLFEAYASGSWQVLASGASVGTVQNITGGSGLLGGTITANGTLSVDFGTAAFKVVQENASSQIAQGNGNAALPAYSFANDPDTGLFDLGNGTAALATNGTARFVIDAGGNVGVGTSQPASGFDVSLTGPQGSSLIVPRDSTVNRPSAPVNGMIRYNNSLSAFEAFANGIWQTLAAGTAVGTVQSVVSGSGLVAGTITAAGTINVDLGTAAYKVVQENAFAQIAQNPGSVTAPSFTFANTSNTGFYSPGVGTAAFATNGAARLVIDGGGNVGVGTSQPASGFDIALTGTTSSALIVPRDSTANRPTSPVNGMIRYNSTVAGFEAFANGLWQSIAIGTGVGTVQSITTGTGLLGGTITANGTININAGTAAGQIAQENGNGQLAQSFGAVNSPAFSFANDLTTGLFAPGAGTAALATSGTARLTITSTGAIGIGTTQPAAGLDLALTGSVNSALILPRDTTANRPTTPVNGMIRYNSFSNLFEAYASGSWQVLASGTSVGTVQNITGGSGLLGGTITANGTLSVDFGTAALKVVQENAFSQIAQGNGNVLAPAFSFANNTTTGLYSPGAGTAAFATNGTARLTLDNVGNIGVGTAAPAAGFDIALTGLSSALLVPRDSTANRPSTPVNGMIRYNSSVAGFEAFANGSWQTIAVGAGVGTVQSITASTGLLGGVITANGTVSVNVGTAPNQIAQENASGQLVQSFGNATTPAYAFANDPDTGLFDAGPGTAALATNGTARLTIDSAGNVGLGTTAPAAALDLQAPTGQVAVKSTTPANPTYAKFMNFATALFGVEGTTAGTSMTNSLSYAAILNNQGSAAVQLGTNNIARLTITPTGAVGIGTTLPLAGLDLALTGNVNSAVILPRDTTANRPATPVNGMIRYNSFSNLFEAYASGSWQVLASGGSVGTVQNITGGSGLLGGTITANGTLSVDFGTAAFKVVQENASSQIAQANGSVSAPAFSFANATTTGLYSPGAGTAAFATNGTARLTIDGLGNLGVGTTQPASGLDLALTGPLSSALIVPRDTTANRPTTPVNGMIRYNSASNLFEAYASGSWQVLASGGSVGTVQNITGGSGLLGGTITANGTLSVDFGTAAFKVVQENASSQIAQANGNVLAPAFSFANNTTTGLYSPGAGTAAFATNGTARLTLDNAGNVGVGTTQPAAGFDISLTGLSSALLVPRDSTANRPTGLNGMLRYNASTNAFEFFQNNTWVSYNTGSTSGTVTSVTGGTGLLGGTITSAGTLNVNVGTGAGQIVQLNVAGQALHANGAANVPAFAFANSTSTGLFSPAVNQLALTTAGTAALTIAANGYVGIGVTSPAYQLEVAQTIAADTAVRSPTFIVPGVGTLTSVSSTLALINSGAADITFSANNLEKMRVTSAGNVGIGTSIPQAGLDVATTGTGGSALIVPRDSTANRPTTPVNGMIRYNSSSSTFEAYVNGSWQNFAVGAGVGTVQSITTGTGLLGGTITSNGTINVNAGTAAGQIAQENVNGQLAQSFGAVGSPAFSFANDLSTGLFAPGAGTAALATSGTARLTITSTGAIGVGTSLPAGGLDLALTGNVNSALILPRDTTANRPTTPVNGMIRYNSANNLFEAYASGSWQVLASGTSVGTVQNITGGSGLLGGTITSNGTLSVDFGTAALKVVQENASSQIAQSNGNALAPSFSFANNTTTGLYSPGAGTAALATNGTARLTLDNAGNIGVGTTQPAAGFDISLTGLSSALLVPRDSTANRPSGLNGMLRYNASTNAFEFFQNNTWVSYNTGSTSGTVTSITGGTGLLGGTITAAGTLNVNVGTGSGQIVQLNVAGQSIHANGAANMPSYAFANSTGTGLFSPALNQLALTTAGTTALTIGANGFVGIGVSSPAYQLEVAQTIAADTAMRSPTYMVAGIGALTNVSSTLALVNSGAADITLSTNNTEKVRVTSAGNVSIGTSIPQAGLDIATTGTGGSALIVPRDSTANRPTTPVNGMIRYNSFNNLFEAYASGSWQTLASGSSVGTVQNITGGSGLLGGTITANGTLSVDFGTAAFKVVQENASSQIAQGNGNALAPAFSFANSTTTGFYSPGAGTASFATNGTARLTVDGLGNLGVGTTQPAAGFDIALTGSLSSALIVPRDTTANRPSTPVNGMIRYNSASNLFEAYASGSWQVLASGGSVGTVQNITGGSGLLGGTITANGTLSVDFGTAALKVVQENANAQIAQGNGNVLAPSFSFANNTTTGLYSPGAGTAAFATNGTARLTLDNAGNVGVGTTQPAGGFDISLTGLSSALLVPRDTTANRPSGLNGMLRYNASTNAFEFFQNNTWVSYNTGSTSGTVTSITGGTGLLGGTITAAGTLNVNVGTGAGQIVQLNVAGQSIHANGAANMPSYAFVNSTSTGLFSPAANQLALTTAGTTALTIGANGFVGIGVTSPAYQLEVAQTIAADTAMRSPTYMIAALGALTSAGSNLALVNSGAADITFATNNTEKLRITSAGNVAIGTSIPQAGLDIATTGTGGSALIVPRDSTANRPTTPVNGMIRYNSSSSTFEAYVGGSWQNFAVGAGVGTVQSITTGTGLLGGTITSNGTINVNAGTAAGQIAQENVNGQLAQSFGAVGSPAFSFANDLTTGLFAPGAGTAALATSGTARLTITSTGAIGVGTSLPAGGLDLALTGNVNSALIVPRDTTANRPTTPVNGMIRYNSASNLFEAYASGSWQVLASGGSVGTVQNITGGSGLLGGTITANGTLSVDFGTAAFKVVQENASSQIAQANGNVLAPAFSFANNTTTGLYSPGAGTAAFATNGTARLTLDNAGNIGVGTSAPATGFDISLTGLSSALLVPRDTTTNRPSGLNGMLRYNTSTNALEAYANGSWQNLFTGSGQAGTLYSLTAGTGLGGGTITTAGTINVNVGNTAGLIVQEQLGGQILQTPGTTSAPAYSFAGNTGSGLSLAGSNVLSLNTAGTSAMTILANGNVGIGTVNPTSRLHVNDTSFLVGTSATTGGAFVVNGAGANGYFGVYDSSNSLLYGMSRSLPAPAGTTTIGGYYKGLGVGGASNGGNNPIFGVLTSSQSGNGPGNTALTVYDTNKIASFNSILDDGAGNMGLGTTSVTPGAGLEIRTTGTAASSLLIPRDSTSNRPVGGTNGMIRYNTSLAAFEGFANGTWQTFSSGATAGTVQSITASTGLLGGTITANGTISVNVGTGASQIIQLNGAGQSLLANGAVNSPSYAFSNSPTSGLFSPAVNQIALATNGTAAMTITATGLVGFGTATPQAGADFSFTGTAASAILLPRDTTTNRPPGANGMIRYNTSTSALESFVNGLWQNIAVGAGVGTVQSITTGTGLLGGTITSNGTINVNAGTAAGQVVLEQNGGQILQANGGANAPAFAFSSSTGTGLYSPAANQLALSTNGTSAMTILASGFVGIGSAVPTTALTVNGTVKANSLTVGSTTYQASGELDAGAGSYTDPASGLLYDAKFGGAARGIAVSGTSYFAKSVGIGTTAPNAGLDVALTGASSAILVPRDSTTNRPTGINGMLRYNATSNAFEFFQNNVWVSYNTGSTSGTVTSITAGTGLAGGTITAAGTINVNVGNTTGLIVQEQSNNQIVQTSGTASAPTYSFLGSLTTGLFSPGTNQLALAANGTAAITIAASGAVGIGTTTPLAALHLNGNANFGVTVPTYIPQSPLNLVNSAGGAIQTQLSLVNTGGGGGAGSAIDFFTYDASGGTNPGTRISAIDDGNYSSNFVLLAKTPGAAGNALTEKFRVNSSGAIGISSQSPAGILDVNGTGSLSAMVVPRDTTANRPTTGVNGMLRYNASTSKFEVFEAGAWGNLTPSGGAANTVVQNGNSFGTIMKVGSNDANNVALIAQGTTALTATPAGNVTIAGQTTTTGLNVTGAQAYTTALISTQNTTPLTVDFGTTGNIAIWKPSTAGSTASATVNLYSVKAGGSYTIIVRDTATSQLTFNCYPGTLASPGTALTSSFMPSAGGRAANASFYNVVSDGSYCYVIWLTGLN